mgnify:CR=1 FL=1
MSELGEIFSALREQGKQKRKSNAEASEQILIDSKIPFKYLSCTHIRVGEYDFWPSTGLFIHVKTKKRGRGIFNLMRRIK